MAAIEKRFSVGNLVTIVVLIATTSGAWYSTQHQVVANKDATNALAASIRSESEARSKADSALEVRVRPLELQAARSDERFNSVLQVLGRIEARLERMERGGGR